MAAGVFPCWLHVTDTAIMNLCLAFFHQIYLSQHQQLITKDKVSTVHQLCSGLRISDEAREEGNAMGFNFHSSPRHWITEYWKVWLTVQVTWMVVGLRTMGLCSRTMTSPSSFCTCLWSTPFAGGLISADIKEKFDSVLHSEDDWRWKQDVLEIKQCCHSKIINKGSMGWNSVTVLAPNLISNSNLQKKKKKERMQWCSYPFIVTSI